MWHQEAWGCKIKPPTQTEITGSRDTRLRVNGTPVVVDQAAQCHQDPMSSKICASTSSSLVSSSSWLPPGCKRAASVRGSSPLCSPSEGTRNPASLTREEELSRELPETDSSRNGQNGVLRPVQGETDYLSPNVARSRPGSVPDMACRCAVRGAGARVGESPQSAPNIHLKDMGPEF